MKRLGLSLLIIAAAVVAGCASPPKKAAKPPVEAPPPAAETKPAPVPEPAPAPMAPVRAPDDSYTVVRGDHLWGISSMPKIYGNPYQWPLLYKANSDQIQDADLIHPGQVLKVDRNAMGADIDAAVRHARTRGAWSLGVVEESDKAYLSGR